MNGVGRAMPPKRTAHDGREQLMNQAIGQTKTERSLVSRRQVPCLSPPHLAQARSQGFSGQEKTGADKQGGAHEGLRRQAGPMQADLALKKWQKNGPGESRSIKQR